MIIIIIIKIYCETHSLEADTIIDHDIQRKINDMSFLCQMYTFLLYYYIMDVDMKCNKIIIKIYFSQILTYTNTYVSSMQ